MLDPVDIDTNKYLRKQEKLEQLREKYSFDYIIDNNLREFLMQVEKDHHEYLCELLSSPPDEEFGAFLKCELTLLASKKKRELISQELENA